MCPATNSLSFDPLFCPYDHSDSVDFDALATGYYDAATAAIMTIAVESGRTLGEGQFVLEEELLAKTGSRCWASELGYAFQLAHQGGRLIDNALAQLALYNARLGKRQDITLRTARGSYLIVAGIAIGSAGFVEIHSDQMTIDVHTENLNLKFEDHKGYWECTSHPSLLRKRARGTNLIVTGGNCLDPELVYAVDPPGDSTRFDTAVSNIEAAISLIVQCVPEYGPWCERFLRQVHVIGQSREDASFSRSSASRPGYVVASAPMPVVLQAEMLVHECTHQYYFLLELLTRIPVDPESKERFFSPLVGRERPIERLLVAYHAVANMLLFHTELLRNYPEHSDLSRERIGVLKPAGTDMLDTLNRNSRLLTANANAFWQPSRSRIENLAQNASAVENVIA